MSPNFFQKAAWIGLVFFLSMPFLSATITDVYSTKINQIPTFREVDAPYSSSEYSSITAKNETTIKYLHTFIFDRFVYETVPDKKIGICIDGKDYLNSNYDVKDGILVKWNYPIGERNMQEFGRCRQFEIDKGLCTEEKISIGVSQ